MMETIKLTQYSHGAGCGCKIAPSILKKILTPIQSYTKQNNVLVNNESNDDAAVYDLGNGFAIISTTDFFMPIVDDPYTFGQIAATNAISDIYAMGGKPIMAVAILGWPLDKLPTNTAQQVIEGGRKACNDAGISISGGHSIDTQEPIFGLAVTGIVEKSKIKRNSTAKVNDHLFLSKPIGIGIHATAQKRGMIIKEDSNIAISVMCQLNVLGTKISEFQYVNAMTDVTGFGLGGHLLEVCESSNLQAILEFDSIPILRETVKYIHDNCVPGGTSRNYDSYGHKITKMTNIQKCIICDPQTSGGLLISISEEYVDEFRRFISKNEINIAHIGRMSDKKDDDPIGICIR